MEYSVSLTAEDEEEGMSDLVSVGTEANTLPNKIVCVGYAPVSDRSGACVDSSMHNLEPDGHWLSVEEACDR